MGEIKLVLTSQLHHFWLAFTVLEGALYTTREVLPSVNSLSFNNEQSSNTCLLVQQWHKHHGSNQPFLNVFKSHSTK